MSEITGGPPEGARPFEEMPRVQPPEDYFTQMERFLSACYEEHGPVFRSPPYEANDPAFEGKDLVFMVGPEANRRILSEDRPKFSHRGGWGIRFGMLNLLGDGLLTMDGEEHSHYRKMMNPLFGRAFVDEHYLPIVREVISERTADWVEREHIDLYAECRKITFDVAAWALAGFKPGGEVDRLRELYAGLLAMTEREPDPTTEAGGSATDAPASPEATPEATIGPAPGDLEALRRVMAMRSEVHEILTPRIEASRKNPGSHVLGMLTQARDQDGATLTEEQLVSHTNILLVAGHETASSLAGWFLYLLGANPSYEKRISEERESLLGSLPGREGREASGEDYGRMKVLERALLETERLYPPVPNGPRGVVEDFEFGGYHIPAGSFVLYSIAACHHAPSIWRDPASFDPDRFAPPREEQKQRRYSLVTFGGGPRTCLGINLAKLEMKALATDVLTRYRLEVDEGTKPAQFNRGSGRPLGNLPAQVYRR